MPKTKSDNKYAIIQSGGKQYRVAKDEFVDVELLNAEQGKEVKFEDVLYFFDGKNSKVGTPAVSGCIVKGELVGTISGPKITSVKYKRSHNEVRKFGHRQKYSRVKITAIGA